MKIEKIPQTFRVWCDVPGYTDFYVTVIPSAYLGENIRDFLLAREGYATFDMFSCAVESDEHAARLALANMPDYISEYPFED